MQTIETSLTNLPLPVHVIALGPPSSVFFLNLTYWFRKTEQIRAKLAYCFEDIPLSPQFIYW